MSASGGEEAGRAAMSAPAAAGAMVLDLERELRAVLERATARVRARFGAMALLDGRQRLTRLLTAGISDGGREAIGQLPHGRGVLGTLLGGGAPIRLEHLASDPRSFGVPAAHPLVHGFLGAPILVAGAPAGSIYFANSEQGAFDEVDERTAVAAAAQAASILLRGAGSHDD